MKKIFFLFSFFLFANIANAGSFPDNTKEFSFDSINNTTCTSTTSILLSAVNYDRTILYTSIISRQAGDNHIGANNLSYPYNLLNDCEIGQSQCNNFNSYLLPANNYLFCLKTSTNDHTWFKILYTDYNLASTTDQIIINYLPATSTATSTFFTMASTSIENIGYTALETQTASGTQITAQFSAPIVLYIFIISLVCLCLYIFKLFLISRK